MKGVIVMCLANMVSEKFGKTKWEESLQKAGLPRTSFFLATQDIDDKVALNVVGAVCQVLNISLAQAAEAFGDYWVNVFAVQTYAPFYRGVNSAKDFLMKLDKIHLTTTQTLPNAHPPRFDYAWKDDKTLIMTYKSERGLMDFFIGLIKGVGKYFNENLGIKLAGKDKVEITFE